ncbi:hypothetical protein CMI47_01390 [Candidatus Pacearchaeota archaeon]|jgi:hypothetical protein|nr:hypothetical protein [Candidatus Pacearchaeota archaeon]|tara:strand:+ start:1877 stop:2542 length:666 start_codon:yes stop_codon:yes gene_type:complete
MSLVDWTSQSKKTGGGSSKFLKLEPNKTFRIRPVHKPVVMWKYFVEKPGGGFGQAITEDPDHCIINKKYGETARKRFAVNVIDREDGQMKVLEGPISILSQIGIWAQETDIDPGSNDGGEFAIKVECPGSDRRKTRYVVQYIKPAPFTDEEKEMIKENIVKLETMYKSVSQDEIENSLYGNKDEESSSGGSASSESAPVASGQSSPKAESNGDDFMNDLDF